MKLLLHDTSILIDLMAADLLDVTFRLPYVMETTDFVIREIVKKEQHDAIQRIVSADLLTVSTASPNVVNDIFHFHQEILALTIADCSVICQALASGAIVLSGDGLLRKTARRKSLKVCGTLWVFQQVVLEGFITPCCAIEKLSKLMAINARLPKAECDKMIEQWKRNKTHL